MVVALPADDAANGEDTTAVGAVMLEVRDRGGRAAVESSCRSDAF